jgi:hypothetical protein
MIDWRIDSRFSLSPVFVVAWTRSSSDHSMTDGANGERVGQPAVADFGFVGSLRPASSAVDVAFDSPFLRTVAEKRNWSLLAIVRVNVIGVLSPLRSRLESRNTGPQH